MSDPPPAVTRAAPPHRARRVRREVIATRRSRCNLTIDLPGLPPEIAEGADPLTLAIVSACWLDLDDRREDPSHEYPPSFAAGRVTAELLCPTWAPQWRDWLGSS